MSQCAQVFFKSLVICCLLAGSSSWSQGMDGPDNVDLDSLVNIYRAVTFDHAMHTESISCAACHHHTTGDRAEDENCLPCHAQSKSLDEVSCSSCHPGEAGKASLAKDFSIPGRKYHIEKTGLKRAYHLKCLGCHKEMNVASGCEDCHPKITAAEGSVEQNQE